MIQREREQPGAAPEIHKQRCPATGTTQFYFTVQGLSYRCRHCKNIHVITWPEIAAEHLAFCGEIIAPHT